MVEFCHIYCGELTKQDCLNSLVPFIDRIKLTYINNIKPQVRALNTMLSIVSQDFFVELDSDMILNENALDRIEGAIEKHKHDPSWHSILFKLYDTFTGKEILALKVMRSKIMKQFLFKDTPTPDVEHYASLQGAGYRCIDEYLPTNPIGKHILKGNNMCYHKYKDVYSTLIHHKREWDNAVFMGGKTVRDKSKRHFDYFLYMYSITNNDDYLAAIVGMVDGLTNSDSKSKSINKSEIYTRDCIDRYFDYYNKGIL